MFRRATLVAATVVALVATSAGAAQAGGWDLITDRSGNGSVTLRGWTRNYNQVAYVADHPGTRVSVSVSVDCRNGDSFDRSWSDGGDHFRFILRGLGNSRTCNHRFRVVASQSGSPLDLALYAR
jgi:hypothetical protein